MTKIARSSAAQLRIADNFVLPLETTTQSIAIVAKKRVGKSYLARRFAEQSLKAQQQTVIIDPKGDWWGIRSSADGKGEGYPVTIFGGERGDVPLEVGAGELIAKIIAEDRVNALLDLSLLRKHEVATFMAVFLETLYRLKAREQFRTPLMLIIDEADAIAPQKPQPNEARMLGAVDDIVRRGGQRGLGCMLITQRTAVLNKNVLTQTQLLIALRTTSPQDLAAMNEWIAVHGEKARHKILMESLPSLPIGDFWAWSPGWPTDEGVFLRAHTSPIETFDSGATPKAGQRRAEPKTVAQVDLVLLRESMAEIINNAKRTDPKILQKRVAELEKKLADTENALKDEIDGHALALLQREPGPPVIVEVDVLRSGEVDAVRDALTTAQACVDKLTTSFAKANRIYDAQRQPLVLPKPKETRVLQKPGHVGQGPGLSVTLERKPKPAVKTATGEDAEIGNGMLRRILSALAQRPNGLTKKQIAVRTGYAMSGSFANALAKGRKHGWLGDAFLHDRLLITMDGTQALGDYDVLPTGAALLAHWEQELGNSMPRQVLSALAKVYPDGLTKAEAAEATGYALSGSFANALAKLRGLELISGKDRLQMSKELSDAEDTEET